MWACRKSRECLPTIIDRLAEEEDEEAGKVAGILILPGGDITVSVTGCSAFSCCNNAGYTEDSVIAGHSRKSHTELEGNTDGEWHRNRRQLHKLLILLVAGWAYVKRVISGY